MPIAISAVKDLIPDWLVLTVRFTRKHGALPNLLFPQSLNEKVLHRIIFDRSRRMAELADKCAVRDFIASRCSEQVLPRLYHVTDDPETIPFDSLPARFVIKPSHGSGWVRVVQDKDTLDRQELIGQCRSWLGQNYYRVRREWAYKTIPPRIMIEELIDDGRGATPNDYKLHVFNGRVRMILAVEDRFKDRTFTYLDRDWNLLDVSVRSCRPNPAIEPPRHLARMIEIAEAFGRETDMIRVDFYDTEDRVVIGELTTSPGGGLEQYLPASADRDMGAFWNYRKGTAAPAGRAASRISDSFDADEGLLTR